ncbi:MAG: hypothetical protein H6834_06855 [Planctomycetes bacterium]|nr:hypothetical protein [Planctomycetota bacterium]
MRTTIVSDNETLVRRFLEHHGHRYEEPPRVASHAPDDESPLVVLRRDLPASFPLPLGSSPETWIDGIRASWSKGSPEAGVLWMRGFDRKRRVCVLIVPDDSPVPWEALLPPLRLEEDFAYFEQGRLQTRGDLDLIDGVYRPRFDDASFPQRERSVHQRATRIVSRAPLIRVTSRIEPAAIDAARQRWLGLMEPFRAFGVESLPTELWLHDDPSWTHVITGATGWEVVEESGRIVHWLVPPDGNWQRHGGALVSLLLRTRYGDSLPTWWYEGVTAWLVRNPSDLIEDIRRSPLLDAGLIAQALSDSDRYLAWEPWERQTIAALSWIAVTRLLPSPEAVAVTWEQIAGEQEGLRILLATWCETFRMHDPPVIPASGPFVRGIAIGDGFHEGLFDLGYLKALDRARVLGANRITLTVSNPPALGGVRWNRSFEYEYGIACAQARGMSVRVRLRLDEVASAQFLGQYWYAQDDLRDQAFERSSRCLVHMGSMARHAGADQLEVGVAMEGTFGEGRAGEGAWDLDGWREMLTRLRIVFGDAIVLALRDPVDLRGLSMLLPEVLAVSVSNLSAQKEPLRTRQDAPAVGVAAGFDRRMRNRAWQFAQSMSILEEGWSQRRLELRLLVHAHSLANDDPDRPRGGADDLRRQEIVLRSLLRAATSHPAVGGVVLEGGEVDRKPNAALAGLSTPSLEREIGQCFRSVTAFEMAWMRRHVDALRALTSGLPLW